MKDYAFDFGLNLKKLRTEMGYSQNDMARRLEMSQAGYSCYENNTSVPPSNILFEISRILNTTTDYLLGRYKKPPIVVDTLTDEQIELLRKMADIMEGVNRK